LLSVLCGLNLKSSLASIIVSLYTCSIRYARYALCLNLFLAYKNYRKMDRAWLNRKRSRGRRKEKRRRKRRKRKIKRRKG
jgi:hypothetical protein